MSTHTLTMQHMRDQWNQWPATTRQRVRWAALVLVLLALWFVGLQPALRLLAASGPQHRLLDAQLSQMQAQAAQAGELQNKPVVTAQQAAATLDTQVRTRLGTSATLKIAGDQASISLRAVSGETLAQFLAQARAGAASTPIQAQLTRSTGAQGQVLWSGTLTLRLPAAS